MDLEEKYPVKFNEDFHRKRRMFCILEGELKIAEENCPLSHAGWFLREKWISLEDDSLFDEIVRGYVDNEGNIYFYSGYRFVINSTIEKTFFNFLTKLRDELCLGNSGNVFGGMILDEKNELVPNKFYGKIGDF